MRIGFTVFKVYNGCSQAGDLCHHSRPYPCLLLKRHRRRPSPVSTRMNTLCIPVSTVLFTMMCSVSLIVSLSSISCIHHHSSSAEKRCLSAQCRALSLPLSQYLQMARRYLLDRSSVHHWFSGLFFDFVSQSWPGVFIVTHRELTYIHCTLPDEPDKHDACSKPATLPRPAISLAHRKVANIGHIHFLFHHDQLYRVKSSIPNPNTGQTWVYPSQQMFWNAMKRKGF